METRYPIVKQYVRRIIKNRKTKHYFISVGKILPKDWEYVLIRILRKENDRVLMEIVRMNNVRRNK